MGNQARLPGTLPIPAVARKNHAAAVHKVRIAEGQVDNLRAALREARAALREAEAERRAAEDDLDAIDAGRRPG